MRDGKSGQEHEQQQTTSVQPPSINLSKGGGAIRGIGEKFAANPVTGTGSMTVPIATSPGRSGFGPQLNLSYDSGAGNGPFGFGWNLSLPAITRKTDKGLPQYRDAVESDVFLLSGAEDLVPELNADGTRFEDHTSASGYLIHRYRPRIEGLFARIERWTRQSDGDVHWRSISKDNILTLYGKDANSRIYAPDEGDSNRIFSWLICETRDTKGNAVLYEYKPEDGAGVDLARASERNRGDREDQRRTTNRYIKSIRYGNRTSLLNDSGHRPRFLEDEQIENAHWMFEVVFDYGEHDAEAPKPDDTGQWDFRDDPFSNYRSGFEVRTTRLCQRVLMFHHFPDESDVGNDCLVRSTDFTYSHEQEIDNARNPVYTFVQAVTQTGYKRANSGFLKRTLPPIEFEYTQPVVQSKVEEVDLASLENLPIGVDGTTYQWTDLHGEGIPGLLTEQADAWFYKRNLSPISERLVEFAPQEQVNVKPTMALAEGAQFMDLAGDGQPDLVVLDGSNPGLYEHDGDEGWQPFRPFTSHLNRDTRDPNLRFVDLDGDGHADILITENDAFIWHAALAEEGFGPARRAAQALDEEQGPRLVFADGTQSIYLADLSGDGLTDLVRIRNGEVCYWPNLGYARFGSKVTMDHAPYFDTADQFEYKRILLADIDGSGTTDIIYLHRDGVRLYFNQAGNGWSSPHRLQLFPRIDDLVSIAATDLLGNGTACLVWSSPAPCDKHQPMRYVNLMGGQKPHLLVKIANNLGAETHIHYTPSTKFYLQDKRDGRPWITRLPYPVHVVERVESYDYISRNRFHTHYAYHHGHYDGEEREFRGFGMVEQWDTEELAALTGGETPFDASNIEATSHVPPVYTKTWFHTGIYLDMKQVTHQFESEYYREPGLSVEQARSQLLADTVLPSELSAEEEREACRALKGFMLRQEIYAHDGSDKADLPYTVTEQNFTIRLLQNRQGNRHAVLFAYPREVINYHYERKLYPVLSNQVIDEATAATNPSVEWHPDPRVQHALTLEVDDYGNVLKELAVGYGRRYADATLPLQADRDKQTQSHITYTENQLTNAIDDILVYPGHYLTPQPCETGTYELTGFEPENNAARFTFDEWTKNDFNPIVTANEIPYEQNADIITKQKRLIEQVRTLYRKNDLTAILPLGEIESLALPGESYQLAYTPGLLEQVFQRNGLPLLPDFAAVLGGQGADQGGYLNSQTLRNDNLFPPNPANQFWTKSDEDDHWWIPSGRIFHSPSEGDTAAQELSHARERFFLPHRYRDPFGSDTFVLYDAPVEASKPCYDLLVTRTSDALGNEVTAVNDYLVLQPSEVTDPNGNRTQVAFDTLGMVAGTAVMGKPEENLGDSLDGFKSDLTEAEILDHLENPLLNPHTILGRATSRLVYDLFAYHRTKDKPDAKPATVYSLVRVTHDYDLDPGDQTKVQHNFSYSDGFGREIQQKIQAEPGPVPVRDTVGQIVVGPDGQPQMTADPINPRWVGSGWIIYNNKGKPVRQYEPFFTDFHHFEFDLRIGVSPVIFYDPAERVVATLHPNHTYEKVVFGPWRQTAYDVNDTVAAHATESGDPRTDSDIAGFVAEYFKTQPDTWQTWHHGRITGAIGVQEKVAAEKAALHANTPATTYYDSLGRAFLTLTHNRFERNGEVIDEKYPTRVELDIEGNERTVRDAIEQNGDALC